MDILEASAEHLDALVPLFDSYRVFYRQPSDPTGARRFLAERIAGRESRIFLALVDSKPAGFVQLYPSFSSASMQRLWILNDLYVASDARRQGVGQALLERARQLAEETGAKGLTLSTETGNTTAQRLYESLGWKRDEDFLHYFRTAAP
ncbi:MAG: GNAT family N-acetyltransferase [Acidobacteriota bacterium]|nr:GNAT family N-acetyltransferase [Acidobacteriota bacterium]